MSVDFKMSGASPSYPALKDLKKRQARNKRVLVGTWHHAIRSSLLFRSFSSLAYIVYFRDYFFLVEVLAHSFAILEMRLLHQYIRLLLNISLRRVERVVTTK